MTPSQPEGPTHDIAQGIPEHLPTREHRAVPRAPAAPSDAPMAIPLPPVQSQAARVETTATTQVRPQLDHPPHRWRRWSVAVTALAGIVLLVVIFRLLTLESPRLSPIRDVVVKVGQTALATAELEDPRTWAGNVHFSLADDSPPGAAIDPATGEFSWSPALDQAGRSHVITARVARSATNRSPHEQSFAVRVNTNGPPQFDATPDTLAKVGDQVAFRARARDSDQPPSRLRYSLVGGHNPPGATLDATTGEFWWPVRPYHAGQTYRLTVEATEQDAQALRATATSILRVHPRMPVGYGLTAQYFADHEWKQQVIERFDRQIDFTWSTATPHPDLKADDFAVRWTGWLRPPTPGEYKIVVISDDGVRVAVDGKTLIDDWAIGPLRRREAQLTLSNKPHALRVEYREHKDTSLVSLRWVRPDGPSVAETIPPECLFCIQETANEAQAMPPAPLPTRPNASLIAEYFNGTNFERLIDRRVEPVIDHWWGLDKPLVRLPADIYSVRWTGRLTPLTPGKYKIVAYSDEGLRVWIDDKPVIDNWKRHAAARDQAEVELTDRPHKLRVEYFEDDHGAVISLRWIVPGDVAEQVIPPWAFSHDE